MKNKTKTGIIFIILTTLAFINYVKAEECPTSSCDPDSYDNYGCAIGEFNGVPVCSNGEKYQRSDCWDTTCKYQCAEYIHRFHEPGISLVNGRSACSNLESNGATEYDYYRNGSDIEKPKPGDVICFDHSNGVGHVAIITSVPTGDTGDVKIIDQNVHRTATDLNNRPALTLSKNDGKYSVSSFSTGYTTLGWARNPNFVLQSDTPTPTTSTSTFCNGGLFNTGGPNWDILCDEVPVDESLGYTVPVFYEGENIIFNAKYINVHGTRLLDVYVERDGVSFNNINHNPGPWDYSEEPHTAYVFPEVQNAQFGTNPNMAIYRFFVCMDKGESDCKANPDFEEVAVLIPGERPEGTINLASTNSGGYPVCGSTNLEGDTYLCGESEGPCFDDHECQTDLICNELYECATDTSYSEETSQPDLPPPQERDTTGLNGDVRYCTDFGPCPVGYGNCDDDSQCQEGLMCEADVGNNWNLSGWANVCVEFLGQTYHDLDVGGSSSLPNGHVDFCSADHPCTEGQGDCNDTTQCVDGLFCEGNAGSRFGMPGWVNVCVAELVGSEAELHGVTEELIASVTKYSEYMSATGRYLLLVPAGTFTKGASSYDQSVGADTEEKPAQRVEITFDFYIDKHEVTEGNWKVMFDGVSPSNNGDNHPVTGISIWDALEYANRVSEFHGLEDCYILNNCTGTPGDGLLCTSVDLTTPEPQDCQGYMLPTSAMWEYAARAGTETSFWAGNLSNSYSRMLDTNVPVEDISWFADNSGGSTHPVCTVTSTHPSGICDVHGNAAEWILGDYRDMPTTTPVTNPFALPTSGVCEYRGGHYESGQPYQLRSFRKGGGNCDADWFTWRYTPGYRGIGTRLARVSVPNTSVPDVSVEEDEEPSEEEESIAEEVVQDSTPISNQCLDFSSIEGQASISHADQTGLDITGSMTIEMWYMPAEQPTWNTSSVLVRKNDSYTVSYYNEENTLYLRWFLWGEGETQYKSPYTLDNNTWYHLAWVYDAPAGTVGVYVDGEFIGQSSDQSHYIDVVASSFDISYNGPIWGVKGSIKEVRVWNTARSSEEIADNYQYQLAGDEPNLAGYWKLDGELADTSANQNDLIWYSDHQAEYCAP